MDLYLEGSKGGEEKAHTPVEAPNNLLSVAYAKVLLAVAEGELSGVPTGKDIFLNGTPLLAADGTPNFGGVTWDWRPGTVDQTYIQGMPSVSNETSVNVELTSTTPYVRQITKTSLSAVRVTLAWPALMKQESNGDTNGVTIDYAIDIATNGGAYVLYKQYQVSGKTNTDYERTHRVDLPKGATNWTLRVRRITPNSESSLIQDTMNIKSFAEVVDAKQKYPNTALLFVQFDSRLFGGGAIPKISVRVKGRLVRVPTNYDPTARTYSGVWDGTFKWAYTNNPAWIFFDIVTQNRFGLGNRVNLNQVDKWELYEVAQYCDVLVDDGTGAGTKEPRHTCNIYIQSQEDAWTVLRDICGIFNGMTYWDGNAFVARADKQEPLDNIPLFGRSNVIGDFNYQTTDERTIFTSALVSYDEPTDHFGTQVEAVWEKSQILRWGGDRQTTMAAIGCTSRGEAQRKGKYTLLTNMFNRSVTFKTGLQGLDPKVRPGAIIGVADPLIAGKEFTGRMTAATLTVVTLDRITEAKAGDKLYITRKDGSQEARTIQAVADRVITLTTGYSEIALPNSVWYLEAEDLKSQLFKIVKLTYDGAACEISGVEYNDSKFGAIDNGARLEPRPISKTPPQAQKAPSDVIIASRTYTEQMMAVTAMTISWPKTQNAVLYEGQWRVGTGDWVPLGVTGATQFEIKGIYSGQYVARVRAINALDIKSTWTMSDVTQLNGKVGAPPALASLTVDPIVFGMQVKWTFAPNSEDTARTEIMYGESELFANARKLGDFAYPQQSHEMNGLKAGARFFFWGRIVDRSGNVGPYFPLTTQNGVMGLSSTDFNEYEEYFKDQINNSALGQELAERIDLIDGPADMIGSVNDRIEVVTDQINQVNTDLSEQLTDVNALITQTNVDVDAVNDKLTADKAELQAQINATNATVTEVTNDLQDQIDSIQDLADSIDYIPANTYTTGQSVLGIDKRLYQAKQNVPINTPPPNTTYWTDIGQVVSSADGLAARVSTVETTVTNQDGRITANANAITGLTSSLAGKADASAVTSLTTRVTNVEGTVTSQGSAITGLTNSLTTTNNNVTAAQTAANNANTLAGGKGKVFYGTSAPAVGEQLSQNLWIDTNGGANTPKRWNGSAWVAVTDKVATDAAAAAANALSVAQTKADASAVTALTTRVTNAEGTITSQGNSITSLNNSLTTTNGNVTAAAAAAQAASDLAGGKGEVIYSASAPAVAKQLPQNLWIDITGNANTPKRWNGSAWVVVTDKVATDAAAAAANALALVVTKADASALTSLASTVTQQGDTITAQGNSLTSVQATLGNIGGNGSNLMPAEYSVYNATAPGTSTNAAYTITTEADANTFGGYDLKIVSNSTAAGNAMYFTASGSSSIAYVHGNMGFKRGKYIVSYRAKASVAGHLIAPFLKSISSDNASVNSNIVNQQQALTTSWTRYSAVVDMTSVTHVGDKMILAMQNNVSGVSGRSVYIDQIMIEEQIGTNTTPSTFAIGNSTYQNTANASAISSLTARVTTAEGSITTNSNNITTLNNNLTTTNGNVTAAQNAANAANTLAGGKGKVLVQTATPAVADQLPQNLWIDMTGGANTPKRWTGSAWSAVTDKVATDAAAAAASALSQVATKAEASAVTDLSTRVTSVEGTVTSQGASITSLNNSLTTTNSNVTAAQAAADAANTLAGGKGEVIYGSTTPAVDKRLSQNLWIDTTGNANTPKRWNGSAWVVVTDKVATDAAAAAASALSQVATKAEAAALNALTNTVTQQGDTITANSNSITSLNATVGSIGGTGNNLVPAEYSVFNVTAPAMVPGGGITTATVLDNTAFTGYALKLNKASGTGTVYLAPSNIYSGANISLKNKKYIVSFYAKSAVGQVVATSLRTITNAGVVRFSSSGSVTITDTNWVRYSAVLDLTSALFVGDKMCLTISPTGVPDYGVDVFIDRVMLEEQVGTSVVPSSFAIGNSSFQNSATASAISALDARVTTAEGNITGQATSITNLNTSINNIAGNGSNLIEDTYSWLTSTTLPVTGNFALTSLGVAITGSASGFGYQLTATSAATNSRTIFGTAGSPALQLTAGKYIVSYYASANVAAQVQVGMCDLGATNVVLGTTNNVTTTRTRYSALVTIPADRTGYMIAYINRAGTTGMVVTIDSVMVERQIGNGVIPSSFAAGSSATSVTANASATNALTTRVTTAEGNITTQAGNLTNLASSIGAAGTNLLNDVYSWITSLSLPVVNGSGTTTVGVAVPEAPSGFGYKMTSTSTSTGSYLMLCPTNNAAGWNIPMEAGTYLVSFWASSATAGATLRNRLYSSTTSAYSATIPLTTTRTRYTLSVTQTVPATQAVLFYYNMSGVSGTEVTIDSVMVEKRIGTTDIASPFTPGTSAQSVTANATATTALTTRVTTAEGQITTQSGNITTLTNNLTTTNGNVTTAQAAADAAATLAGGKGKVMVQSTTPAAGDQLAQNLWIDTTGNANTPKRWTGSVWAAVTDKVATDAAAAASSALTQVAAKADITALNALTTRVTTAEGTLTTQGNSITSINASIGGMTPDNLVIDPTYNVGKAALINTSTVTIFPRTDISVPANTSVPRVAQWAVPTQASANSYLGWGPVAEQKYPGQSNFVSMAPGEVYEVSCDVFMEASGGTRQHGIWFQFYDAAVASVGHNWVTGTISNTNGSWKTLTGKVTVPDTVVMGRPTIRASIGNATNIWVANMRWTKQNPVDAATATAITSLNASVTQNGTDITTQSGYITSLQNTVGGIGGSGNNINPSEYAVFNAIKPTIGAISTGLTVSTVLDSATLGGYALKFVSSLTSTTLACYLHASNTVAAVGSFPMSYVNGKYIVSYYAKSTTSGSTIRTWLRCLNATDVAVNSTQTTMTLTDQWVRYSHVVDLSNATTFSGSRMVFATYPNNSGVSGTEIFFDRIMVEKLVGENTAPSVFDAGSSYTSTTAQATAINSLDTRLTVTEGNVTAQATKIDGIFLQVNPVMAGDEAGYAGDDAAMVGVWTEQTARIEDGIAMGQRVDTVMASVDDTMAAIQAEATARADGDSAVAASVERVQAVVNDNTVAVQTVSQAQITADGKASAMWGVKMNINAYGQYVVAGIGLGIENTGAGLQSSFIVNANNFYISNGVNSTVAVPFAVVGGQTFINSAVIQDASITNAKVGDSLQSNDYVYNQSGWLLSKSQGFYMNGVVGGARMTLLPGALRFYHPNGVLAIDLSV